MYAYKEKGKWVYPINLRSRFNGVGAFHTLTDEQRATHGWYVFEPTNYNYDPKTQKRDGGFNERLDGIVFKVDYVVTDKTQEELLMEAREEMLQAIESLIQGEVTKYNEANMVAFKDIDACAKYTTIPTYTHYQFCVDVIAWQTNVWEYARQVQADVLAGTRTMPTVEELLAELPVFGA